MLESFCDSKLTKTFPELEIRSGILLASVHLQYQNSEKALEYLNVIKYLAEKNFKYKLKKKIYLQLSEIVLLMGKS